MLKAATSSQEQETIDPLTRLAIKHGTDKWGPHFYTPHYHSFFAPLRDKPVRLLEIGVGGYFIYGAGGASLAMWAEYFPYGQIVGIDIYEKRLDLGPRVHIRRGAQDDRNFLLSVVEEFGPFNIVIDDGSHIPKHVVTSFNVLFPELVDQGFYVIEDVQTTFWPQYGGSLIDGGATIGLGVSILNHLHHAELKVVQPRRQIADFAKQIRAFHAFHNLFVIEKGDNSEPSNFNYDASNVHAARALRSVEEGVRANPSANAYANLIEMLIDARNFSGALALVREALKKMARRCRVVVCRGKMRRAIAR